MAEPTTNGNAEMSKESVIISVVARSHDGAQRATILDDTDSAQRLVEAIIEAGCDSARVQAFSSREVRVGIEYNPTVALYDNHGGIIAATLAETVALPVSTPASVPTEQPPALVEPEPELVEALPVAAPEPNFHFRVDRVVFACLWAASLIVLLASLLVSLSRSSPREFVPGVPDSGATSPSPATRALGDSSAPNEHLPACAQNGIESCRCADFATWPEAQLFYTHHPPAPGHIVDTDGDGIFCEWLPAATAAP